jgi:hypothetical protein
MKLNFYAVQSVTLTYSSTVGDKEELQLYVTTDPL